jgi:hypothetical protein
MCAGSKIVSKVIALDFFCIAILILLLVSENVPAQSIRFPWNGYGHDAQHSTISAVASQPLNHILWQVSVDLTVPTNNTGVVLIHYGSPSITRSNTVIVPVRTTAAGGFEMMALNGENGRTNWVQATDYFVPSHGWILSCSGVLTPKNRFYFPGGGGTVYYCDTPDTTNASPVIGQIAFYGLTNYLANTNAYLTNVFIDTPITSDRYGNIFFGFQVKSSFTNFPGGIARIDCNGACTWLAASNAAGDSAIKKPSQNCAPALSNDHKTLYIAVNNSATWSDFSDYGYLVALDSRTLAPLASVLLKDVKYPANNAYLPDDGTASPTVGPDGDVYYGVLENPAYSNNDRGWLLHFNSALTQTKTPGAFGWDDTASIVPASLVSSYHGNSPYLLMTKYNNYAGVGSGNGVNKIAILDPQNSMTDPISGDTNVMNEVITVTGPTPDSTKTNSYPNAVREWCINSAAVDPFTKSVLANNEDGNMYRWDLTSNILSQTITLTAGVGEAYTPTIIGVDGTVYAINNAILFAIGH